MVDNICTHYTPVDITVSLTNMYVHAGWLISGLLTVIYFSLAFGLKSCVM